MEDIAYIETTLVFETKEENDKFLKIIQTQRDKMPSFNVGEIVYRDSEGNEI